jgi:hypothetical protein
MIFVHCARLTPQFPLTKQIAAITKVPVPRLNWASSALK